MFGEFMKVAMFPTKLNIYNLADKGIKFINKVADAETSDVVMIKDFEDSIEVESVVC